MNTKYKILVLSDLKENSENTLKNAVSLSQIIDAEISLFHVKKANEIVETESQLSAMRVINKQYISIEKKIKDLTNTIYQRYDVDIKASYAFGNVKNEVKNYINTYNPDIIVLGKKKEKILKVASDNIASFLLNTYNGVVVIASNRNGLEPNKEFSLGFLNNKNKLSSLNFGKDLIEKASQPLRSFYILAKAGRLEKEDVSDLRIVDYAFIKNNRTLKTVSNYLNKDNVNLLFVNRDKNSDLLKGSKIEAIIKHINTSLFITNETQQLFN